MTPSTTPASVAVIGGGTSDEHGVSLASAASVVRAIRELGIPAVPLTIEADGGWSDEEGRRLSAHEALERIAGCGIAFPVLHGVDGEDGAAAGFLRLAGVPFVGAPVRAGALGMDKWVTKLIAEDLGIAIAAGGIAGGWAAPVGAAFASELRPPFVVKPTTGGSSNGVFVAPDRGGLVDAVVQARAFGETVLVEEYVRGREVDIAVFRDASGELRLGSTLEIGVVPGGVFDRAEKYDGSAEFTIPASLDRREEDAIRHAAALLYEALGCSGVARFDFFVTETGVVLNEVNTSPGMTEQSQVPRMYAATGLGYAALIGELMRAVQIREEIRPQQDGSGRTRPPGSGSPAERRARIPA